MGWQQAPVSVVIPCYQCGESVERAVASVAAQTIVPAEVILVDDGSADDTVERLHALKEAYHPDWICVVELPGNCGPGTARNAGWEKATQRYLAFLDADDSWHPQKIELQYSWMKTNPSAALTGHASVRIDDPCSDKVKKTFQRSGIGFHYVSPRRCLLSNRFPTRSVMLKRSLPHRFAPGKRHSEDFLLWCDICLDGHPCYFSEVVLAFMYKEAYGEGGLSGDLWEMQKGQMDTYRRLQISGRITRMSLPPLMFWSVLRFARRLVIAGGRGINQPSTVAELWTRIRGRP